MKKKAQPVARANAGAAPRRGSSVTLGKERMSDQLQAKLDSVHDEDSFVAFVSALAADRADEVKKEKEKPSLPYGPGANGWENGSIETFLESAAVWADDWKQSPQYRPPANPWKRCAEILFAGKSYE